MYNSRLMHDARLEPSIVRQLVRPAILRLVAESEGAYRCERDFHHHFTICLSHVKDLCLGTVKRQVCMEEPTFARYGTGRKGNLDYFVPSENPRHRSDGAAIELNYNYRDGYKKIVRDVEKLIDPVNAYAECVYFAYGNKARFFEEVMAGIQRAFALLATEEQGFLLPRGLHAYVVERAKGSPLHKIRETIVSAPCAPHALNWSEISS